LHPKAEKTDFQPDSLARLVISIELGGRSMSISNLSTKHRVFFAIPCGGFFEPQKQIIESLCKEAGLKSVIIEDHVETAGLWEKIARRIRACDLFVADVSSGSPNVALELGYAIREMNLKSIAILSSEHANVPVDLQGFVVQKYSSLDGFRIKLRAWLQAQLPSNRRRLSLLAADGYSFADDFMNVERFKESWWIPSDCTRELTAEGLIFTNCNIPILTTHLGLLGDSEFSFRGRIIRGCIGWVIRGVRDFQGGFPWFCVMFNLDQSGFLRAHILDLRKQLHSSQLYKSFGGRRTGLTFGTNDWFEIRTITRGNLVTILINGSKVFVLNLARKGITSWLGGRALPSAGQIGFRCHPGEVATVGMVRVSTLD
jgi:hypothetical protein